MKEIDKIMKEKTKKTFKKIDKNFKQKRPLTIYMLLSIVLVSVFLSSICFYFIGQNEGYNQKTHEIESQEKEQYEQDLMEMELQQVSNIFLKYLMVKVMFNLPPIFLVIILLLLLSAIRK